MSGDKLPIVGLLKPCPFCGSKPDLWWPRGINLKGRRAVITCPRGRCGAFVGEYKTKAEAVAAWNTRQAATTITELVSALEAIMIGGNHLALLIGADHPPYTAEPPEALTHYGAGDTYEIWCCWRSIMLARDAVNIEDFDDA